MAKQNKKATTMTECLKKTILKSGMSFKAIERETGVKRQSLMKFVRGEQSLRLDIADRLVDYFGLSVVQRKGRK